MTGYGNVVPKTVMGKAICSLYAIAAIPFYLFALSAAGEVKRFHIEFLLGLFETKILKRTGIQQKKEKMIGITAFLFVVELLIASGISSTIESWTYFDCVYFWVISASTIGFGDITSNYNNNMGLFLCFHLLFTIILQADFVAIFDTCTEILSKKEDHALKRSSAVQHQASSL